MLVRVMPLGGNNGIYTDHALTAAQGINTAVNFVKCFSERVRDLIKRD